MRYRLRKEFSTNPDKALKEILQDRGVTDIENFMHPTFDNCELDAHKLMNIDKAAERLLYHLRKNSDILFIVDCDADGYTSSSILWLYIKHIFPDAKLEFTVHEHKQHGFDDKIDWICDEARWDLILCPDAGSYDIEEHRALGELGMDVICLDHHEQLYDENGNPVTSNLPTVIVVNNQLSPDYKNKSLCGAGVVYKFCEVLDEILGIQQAHNYIDLAALGEIADVMDRTDVETNYIMMDGLKHISNGGIKALLKSVENTPSLADRAKPPYIGLTPIDIAFYIAPLINAITRVGTIKEKETMFYCFIEPERPMPSTKRGAKLGDIETAADQTARVGKNAKSRQDKIKERAMGVIDFKIQKDSLDDNNIIIIELDSSDDIPQELTGLIAMNVVTKYHKPVMIGRRNNDNEIQGSIRSDGNFAGLPSFKKFLEDSGLVTYTAGHDNAAGWGLNGNKLNLLLKYANDNLKAVDFENCYIVDYILDGSDYNDELLGTIAMHPEYFGNHIDEVNIVIKNIPLINITPMKSDCMKISYNNIDYVKFRDPKFIEEVTSNRMKKLTVYGRANLNEWMGRKSVQVFINDYELVEDTSKYDF